MSRRASVVLLLLVLVGGWVASSLTQERGDEQRAEGVSRASSDRRDPSHANNSDSVTYENRMYGFALTYDGGEWEDVTGDDDLYDQFFLFNGTSRVGLFTDPDYRAFPLDYCVADYAALLAEEDEVVAVTPVSGRVATGRSVGRAWATFAYALTDDDGTESHRVRSYECRSIGDGVKLVITHDMPAKAFTKETAARKALLAGLVMPGTR
ncbi:MAG: hypothetical protein M3Q71_04850 [Chloroflexota bacterium]|nr:hypothetical protein [Chloroflexota bacterium]